MLEQAQKPDDGTAEEDRADDQRRKVNTGDLCLAGNSTLLEFNRLLSEPAVFSELLALNVADLGQELGHVIGHTYLGGIKDKTMWRCTRHAG